MASSATPPLASSTRSPRPPRSKAERLARVFDDEVHPLYTRRFESLLLRSFAPVPGGRVLEAGCHTGWLTAELLARCDGDSHVEALEAEPALLALARERIGREHPGRRVHFRPHAPMDSLPFSDGHFDTVIAHLPTDELPDRDAAVAELLRVARPGGQVLLTTALRGSWGEVIDVLREVLVRRWNVPALASLEVYEGRLPEAEGLARALEAAGLIDVDVHLDRWELLFRSAREFFYAPVIEHGPLRRWKDIVGRGEMMQAIFAEVSTTIDTYFTGRPFPVGLVAGGFHGRKPTP